MLPDWVLRSHKLREANGVPGVLTKVFDCIGEDVVGDYGCHVIAVGTNLDVLIQLIVGEFIDVSVLGNPLLLRLVVLLIPLGALLGAYPLALTDEAEEGEEAELAWVVALKLLSEITILFQSRQIRSTPIAFPKKSLLFANLEELVSHVCEAVCKILALFPPNLNWFGHQARPIATCSAKVELLGQNFILEPLVVFLERHGNLDTARRSVEFEAAHVDAEQCLSKEPRVFGLNVLIEVGWRGFDDERPEIGDSRNQSCSLCVKRSEEFILRPHWALN